MNENASRGPFDRDDDPAVRRYKGSTFLVATFVAGIFIAAYMFHLGQVGLNMSPVMKQRNELMYAKTLACAEPVDAVKCEAASRALEEYERQGH